MAGSTSLPSVVAVFPSLGGLRTNCRVVCLRPHLHNGVRILWGGVSSSGLAHWRIGGANGVARGMDEAKPAPKARRRTKKAVKEEEGEGIEGAESDSVAPPLKRKSTPKGRKPKVAEAEDASVETKVETRRRKRSSAKSGGPVKTETGASSKVSEAEVGGDETVEKNNVDAPVETGKKGLAAPSVPRVRRRRKAAAKAPDAPANGAAADVEDSNREPEGALLSSSPARDDVHEGDLGFGDEPSSVAEADVEPEKSAKSSRPRKKREKVVKVSGDEELQIRVQETAVPSLNGSMERDGISGAVSEDVGEVQDQVKKKRQRRTKKKPEAVPDSILENSDAAQSVLLDDDSQSSSSSVEDEISNHEDSPEPEEPPPPRKSARRRRRDAQKLAAAQAEPNGDSDASGALMSSLFSMGATVGDSEFEPGSPWNGSVVDTDGGVSRVQFPAPTWGPQWWEEIQSKSQATISFQDIAERKEGFQTRAKVPQEQESGDGDAGDKPEVAEKRADMTESAEQRIDHTVDSDVPNKGDSVFHSNKDELKTRRRIAKLHPAQKSPQESSEDWLRKKMLALGKPTEEPWLLESMIAAESEQESSGEARFAPKQEVIEAPASNEEPRKVVHDVLRPDNGDVKKEPEVEVEILINTSECTMQRMAILENKKLVEFSIEPVNTKVQVGNIYLGRVKQLLPGMSGVFVDIGGSRLALLDIARNQYPYTFPPVYSSENSSSNDSVNGASLKDEDLGLCEDEPAYTEEDDDDEDEDEDEEGSEELLNGVVLETDDSDDSQDAKQEVKAVSKTWRPHKQGGPITVNFGRKFSKWRNVEVGMPIIVQVKKESMGKKGPRLTAFPSLAGRFWVLIPRGSAVGVSARITGPERRRLKLLAQALQPQDLGITVRTEALGHEQEDLERDLTRLIDTWKEIMEKAAAAALAVERGEEAAVPVLLHREMGQTLTIIRDLFTEKISRLVVDSPQSHQEVINYLQEVAPHLISRVILYTGKVPIFDKFNVEVDLERFSSERVKLPNGGYLVMQETEALVSIDVNGGTGMLGHSTKQREAILDVNLAAARQIASEIRLRDIGGIIVVDFIDMDNSEDERLVHEEMRKAIQRDRSKVSISEISEFGLMEMTRKRVRSSVTLTINSTCSTCKGTGRVEALETTLSKIERAIRRVLAEHPEVGELSADASTWPQVLLRVEPSMLDFLKSWKKKRIVQMGHSLKVWISLKAGMELTRGQFEVALRQTGLKKASAEPHHHGSQTNLQQEKAVTAPVLGRRVWPKRKRFFS